MAKVKIQGHASGTGILTVTAPNTSTDRTITLPDATGTLATTADSVGGATGVDFNDNVAVRLGTGNDLKLIHDGTHSKILNYTGDLHLASDNKIAILGGSDTAETCAEFNDNGAVNLYHDHSKKFETTATGVTVTGATNSTVMPTFGGVAIAAHGSNSNGNYFKFADGTMICTADLSTGQQNNGATAGAFYYSNSNTWTYPVAFTGSVKVVGMTQGGHYNAISVKTPSVGTSSCTYMTLSINSTGNAQGLTLFAIGVWN